MDSVYSIFKSTINNYYYYMIKCFSTEFCSNAIAKLETIQMHFISHKSLA